MKARVLCMCTIAVLASVQHAAAEEHAELIRVGKGDWAPYVCQEHLNDGRPGYAADIPGGSKV